MTRREFVRAAGAALVLANFPIAQKVARAATPPLKYGGPTPNSDFYITSYGATPQVDASQWRLKISGLVQKPREITYAEILKLPQIHQTLTLECISNGPDGSAISNAEWVGTRLRPILDSVRVRPGAKYVAMHAADGYFTGVPIAEIMREENFLPYLMNGQPLPAAHGYPVRIFIPGKYGMKQPKWITAIEFVDKPFIGYWEQRGWSDSAWRKINSGFFTPRQESGIQRYFGTAVEAKSPVEIVGWALAGPSGVKRVEVSTDGGATWRDAEIVENKSPYIWTVWKYRFAPARPGKYEVRVRATDGNGVAQIPHDQQAGSGLRAEPRLALNVTG